MTIHEARTIAVLRMHYQCTFSKLAGLARAIWGGEHCKEMTGGRYDYGAPLGLDLIVKMEEVLGLETCESDKMVMAELLCENCRHTQWAICYPSDTEKQCDNCGEMAAVFMDTGKGSEQ